MIKKHYAMFFYSGALNIEKSPREISSRDLRKLKVPDGAFSFKFFDVVSDEVEIDGKKIELSSKNLNVSPMYYYSGRIYTKAEVESMVPRDARLLQSMRDNNWEKVIQTQEGNFQPFFDGKDIFIKEE